ncbi:unnamed protein product, partial [Laminaria digitata]
MKKVFVADDKFSDVIVALERRGWARSKNASSPNFQLKWRNLSNINFRLVRADQFVNHVCNSQQLSNKALLTGHLAFRHEHAHAHARQFSGSSSAKSGADSAFTDPEYVPSKTRQDSRCCCCCAGVPDEETSGGGGSGPEAFFPRCWDVSDGGVTSLLKAFAVSAAAALLRRAVEADEKSLTDEHRGNNKGDAAAIAASISVIARYVAALRPSRPPPPPPPALPPTPLAQSNGPPHPRGRANDPCRGNSRRARGHDAADAVVSVGDPEFVTVLAAWEAVETKEEERGDEKGGGEEVEPAEEEGEEEEREEEEEEGSTRNGTGSAQGRDSCSHRGMNSACSEGASAHRCSPCRSLAGRARETLRALGAADPQSALLGAANAWVVKPAGLSCGRGVVAASSLRELMVVCHRLRWKAVVQKYVERPLLVQGFKFDIRQWVLVTSCNPLVLWGFDESYVRFSSKPFSMDTSSLSDRLIHLCNHSVQKEREVGVAGAESEPTPLSPSTGMPPWNGGEAHHADRGGEGNGGKWESEGDGGSSDEGLPSGSRGHMWTADQLRRYLEDRFQGRDVFRDVVLPRIRSVVVQTLLGVREGLAMKGRALEWLGFDLMVTEDLRVMLIEVNVSPDVSHSTPITARLVPAATEDALRLLLDDGEADARTAAAKPVTEVPTAAAATAAAAAAAAAVAGLAAVAVAGSPVHRVCAVGRREGATGVDEGLRWRLWHKGE